MQWSWLEKEREKKKGVSELVGLLGCVRDEWRIDVCFPFLFSLFFPFFLHGKVLTGERERERERERKKRKENVHEHDASLQY